MNSFPARSTRHENVRPITADMLHIHRNYRAFDYLDYRDYSKYIKYRYIYVYIYIYIYILYELKIKSSTELNLMESYIPYTH